MKTDLLTLNPISFYLTTLLPQLVLLHLMSAVALGMPTTERLAPSGLPYRQSFSWNQGAAKAESCRLAGTESGCTVPGDGDISGSPTQGLSGEKGQVQGHTY